MYESGNEDIDSKENEKINSQARQRDNEAERLRLDSMRQMEINRENQKIKEQQELEAKQEQEKKLEGLSNYLGIPKINERLDELNISQNEIISKLSQIIQVINQGVQQAQPIQEGVQADPMAKMELVSGLIDKATQLYSTYKQNQSPPQVTSIIDPETINEYMRNSVLSNFELGDALIKTLKNKVVGKALTKTVSSIVNDDDEPA